MTRRVLYTGGSIAIAAEGYLHSPYGDGDGDENETEDVPIPGLDRVITNATMLTFTLDYPFPQPYAGRVFGKGGITLRHVIDAIRKGFGAMYAGAGVTDVPNLANRMVAGRHGAAAHAIDDLVIETIELDDATREIDVGIAS